MSQSLPQRVPKPGEKVLFITGRLAEEVTQRTVIEVSEKLNFSASVHVVGISVAALMHVDWLMRKLTNEPQGYDAVYLPGWCQGDLSQLTERFGIPFYLGPKEILDLSYFFGQQAKSPPPLDQFDIEIIAEINHAPRMSEAELMTLAEHYRQSGADVIDVGCIPGETWGGIGNIVKRLKEDGYRVSVDSFDRKEVETAVAHGAELILSCNSTNVSWLSQLQTEVVVIPDSPREMETMWQTVETLLDADCPFRIDPILEPIGFGFAASLARYFEARRQAPDVSIMMGIGNLTEMTEVDSSGVNALLAAICQELQIFSVLTTEVIPWCQSAVKEFDLARRLMHHAIENQTLPKHLNGELLLLRGPSRNELGEQSLEQMAQQIRDSNYRIFVERGEIHVMNRNGYWRGTDAFELYDRFVEQHKDLDASHAFYLGYELAKAVTALTLGKSYHQDQALRWGFLSVPEKSAHERRKRKKAPALQSGSD